MSQGSNYTRPAHSLETSLSLPVFHRNTSTHDMECFVSAVIASLPASADKLAKYKSAQPADSICQKVIQFCCEGWPEQQPHSKQLHLYWGARHKFSIIEDLLLYGSCIIIPSSLQTETLMEIHTGHLGVQKCLLQAKACVCWPGMTTSQLICLVLECWKFREHTIERQEPLISTPLPTHPWEEVGTDLFFLKGVTYLLAVDYFSRYLELVKLTSTTSQSIVNVLKAVFSRHGIPSQWRTDNGPQFA